MKKIYNVPVAKFIKLSSDESLAMIALSGSDGENVPGVDEDATGINGGSELSNRRRNIWGEEY